MTNRTLAIPLVALIGAVTLTHAQHSESSFLVELNAIAQRQLRDRAKEVAAIRDTPAAQARQKQVRERILSLIGGLPDYRGPLNARVTRTSRRDGFPSSADTRNGTESIASNPRKTSGWRDRFMPAVCGSARGGATQLQLRAARLSACWM